MFKFYAKYFSIFALFVTACCFWKVSLFLLAIVFYCGLIAFVGSIIGVLIAFVTLAFSEDIVNEYFECRWNSKKIPAPSDLEQFEIARNISFFTGLTFVIPFFIMLTTLFFIDRNTIKFMNEAADQVAVLFR